MEEKQKPKELSEIEDTVKKLEKLPEKIGKDFVPQIFHRIYTKIVSTDKDGGATLKGADPKKAAETTTNYFINNLCGYLGIKGGLDEKFLNQKADTTGTTFRDLFLRHNGLPDNTTIEDTVSSLIESKDLNVVLSELTKFSQEVFKGYLGKQMKFVETKIDKKILTDKKYQEAAQEYVKEKTGKPTNAIGENLIKELYSAASKN